MYLNNKVNTMNITNISVITLMSLLVAACGGGGGGESSSPSTTTSSTTTVVTIVEDPAPQVIDLPVEDVPIVDNSVEPDPNATYDTTADLIASKSFLLKPEYELAVSYSNEGDRPIYLSVCSEFTEEEARIKVNYNSCLVRTSLESNYSGTLTVANNKNDLIMAIWYLDDIDNPRYEIWRNDNSTDEIKTFCVIN